MNSVVGIIAGFFSAVLSVFGVSHAHIANSPISVPGMSEYTDADFGFSFWYPSGWNVMSTTTTIRSLTETSGDVTAGPQGSIVLKTLAVSNDAKTIYIEEIVSPMGIYWADGCRYCQESEYFSTSTHQWLHEILTNGGSQSDPSYKLITSIVQRDSMKFTMGGLPFLNIYTDENTAMTIALTTSEFIMGYPDAGSLLKTIVATDSPVATPVSAAQQIATIQAEKDAYAGQ